MNHIHKTGSNSKVLYSLKFSLILLLFTIGSCKKDILDQKPDQSLAIPTTLKDFQALVDNVTLLNNRNGFLAEAGADDYYILDTKYAGFSQLNKNIYVWDKQLTEVLIDTEDWNAPYQAILYANVVLEGIERLPASDQAEAAYKNIKGTALFIRSFNYYQLAQTFCKPYSEASAATDPGIPLRESSDINIRSVRSTLQRAYEVVLNGLKEATDLLPDASSYKTRPIKATAFAMLARVYLSMDNYSMAKEYADRSLTAYPALLDYNQLTTNAANPVAKYNAEVLIHGSMSPNSFFLNQSAYFVDQALYSSYSSNDLRKVIFFNPGTGGQVAYKGSYTSGTLLFSGIANDEVYLIRAECNARLSNVSAAMNDLNALLIKRFKTGTFIPLTATTATDALSKILSERRKELVFRGLRWTDLRRLNKDPLYARTISRKIGAETYTLAPGDQRYVYPIPAAEIQYSGIDQNPR